VIMGSKIKLVLGITLSELGGAQKVVYDIISSLDEDKYDITLITAPSGILVEWVDNLNRNRKKVIRVITLKALRREISPVNDIKVFFKLLKILGKDRFDIAHFHSSKMGILGRYAAWLVRVPKVFFTAHGWGINEYQRPLFRKIMGYAESLAGKASTAVICVSYHDRDKGIKNRWTREEKTRVVYNGVDKCSALKGKLKEELSIKDERVIIGTIARLQEPKEPLFAIQVAGQLIKRGQKIHLVIIGDGPLMQRCRDAVNSLGLDSDVSFMGTRQDARELLNDFDIFVLFSKWEGLPLTVIEAMFAGKPVVASGVGGVPELVRDGETGYLVECADINCTAGLIERLITDSELRCKMGLKGKEVAMDRFNKSNMVKMYDCIYSTYKRVL
jgi:glycosyltransferase involved in cell wall biosynthesis